jgi:cell division protein FtsL
MSAKQAPTVFQHWPMFNLGLLLCVVWTAVSVIETTHLCRLQYARLQALQTEEWGMQENWSRLLLEESTWAAHHRVEKLAGEKLAMRAPTAADMKVVLR